MYKYNKTVQNMISKNMCILTHIYACGCVWNVNLVFMKNNIFSRWLGAHRYNPFLVYCRELAPGTVSLTGDRAQGDDSKHDLHYKSRSPADWTKPSRNTLVE